MTKLQALFEKAANLFNAEHKTSFTAEDVACLLGLREADSKMIEHSAFDEARETSMACSEDLVYSLPVLSYVECEELFDAMLGE